MNATQMLEVLIPMLVMLVTFVGLALRVQTNLGRSLDESIDKFRNEVRKDREDDRKALQDFRAEVLDRFETTNHKIDANTTAIAAETNAKIDTNAANAIDTPPPRPGKAIRDLPSRDPGELQGTRRQGRHQRRHPRQEHQRGQRPGGRIQRAGLQDRGPHRSHIQPPAVSDHRQVDRTGRTPNHRRATPWPPPVAGSR